MAMDEASDVRQTVEGVQHPSSHGVLGFILRGNNLQAWRWGEGSFWEDQWLEDGSIPELTPNLLAFVNKPKIKVHYVRDALGGGWWEDVSPDMSAPALREFLLLGDRLADIVLEDGMEDRLVWTWQRDVFLLIWRYSMGSRSGRARAQSGE